METFRCYEIRFFLTNIGVFVLVRIVSLCRISKWPRLDWKMQKIVHFGNLSWNNGQIQWIWCLSRNKLFLTMWEVKFATKVCNIMNYSPNTPTLMFNWCINCFNCKLHLQFVSLLFFWKLLYVGEISLVIFVNESPALGDPCDQNCHFLHSVWHRERKIATQLGMKQARKLVLHVRW